MWFKLSLTNDQWRRSGHKWAVIRDEFTDNGSWSSWGRGAMFPKYDNGIIISRLLGWAAQQWALYQPLVSIRNHCDPRDLSQHNNSCAGSWNRCWLMRWHDTCQLISLSMLTSSITLEKYEEDQSRIMSNFECEKPLIVPWVKTFESVVLWVMKIFLKVLIHVPLTPLNLFTRISFYPSHQPNWMGDNFVCEITRI
mgnify:CR=1 FL=1